MVTCSQQNPSLMTPEIFDESSTLSHKFPIFLLGDFEPRRNNERLVLRNINSLTMAEVILPEFKA